MLETVVDEHLGGYAIAEYAHGVVVDLADDFLELMCRTGSMTASLDR